MSNLYCILGFAFAILFSIIQVGHCCITFQFTVTATKTVLEITCQIPSFTGTGSWFIDGVGPKTSCSANLGCTITSNGNYTFDSNSNGMNAMINPFSSVEIGKLWKCEHPPSFSCNDTVPDPPEIVQKDVGGGLSDGEKAAAISVPTSVTFCGGAAAAIIFIVHVINIGVVIIVIVKKGQDITFGESSIASGVQWTKDGKKVKSNRIVGNRCKVQKSSDDDEGLYVCTLGKYTKKYRLIVLEEIVYVNKSIDTEFGRGSMTDVVWKKDGRVVKSTHSLKSKFIISKSSEKDEGLYICKLKNVKEQFKYYVIVVGTEEIIYVYNGFQTEFGKTIPDENTTKNAQWTHNSQQVGSDHSEHTKFSIDTAYLEHEGLYVCTFGDNHMHQLKYHLIVVGTADVCSVNEGDELRFGKALPMKHAPSNTKWTHEGYDFESDKIKGTEIEIKMASKRDGGLYVLTFGPNNMQCRYTVIVSESKNANANEFSESKKANESADSNNENAKVKSLKKKKNKEENDKQSFAVVETVDETQHRSQNDKKLPPIENSQNDKKLPPVENPTYLGSSPLDQKPFGAPLPTILSKIPQDNTDKST